MISASWQHKMSLVLTLLHHWNLAFIHELKCLCGSCGIQQHTPRDPREVPPTYASGNRKTDFIQYKLWNQHGPEHWLQPAQPWNGSTWKTLTYVDTHRGESLCRSPGFQRRSFRTPLEQKTISSAGERESSEWASGSPSSERSCYRNPFLTHSSQSINQELQDWGVEGKLRKEVDRNIWGH